MIVRFEKEVGVRLLQAWGMTETSPLASVAHPPPGLSREDEWSYRDSQGRLFCTVEGRLSGDGGALLPSDGEAIGEVEVRGPWITGSYYKDDDPAKFHDGWLRTGDVGSLDERGFIRLTDRAKDVIKSGGEWISSMELENVLMAHPDVAEAAVIGVADDKWGERPLAAVVIRPGAEVTAGLHDRADPALAASRALVLCRRSAQDQRGQVLQAADARCLPARRLRGHRGPLIAARPDCFAGAGPVPVRYGPPHRSCGWRIRLVRSMAPHC
jgi:acyl-CoA synthetase (AMP-forming)/AMP-acid ligase II